MKEADEDLGSTPAFGHRWSLHTADDGQLPAELLQEKATLQAFWQPQTAAKKAGEEAESRPTDSLPSSAEPASLAIRELTLEEENVKAVAQSSGVEKGLLFESDTSETELEDDEAAEGESAGLKGNRSGKPAREVLIGRELFIPGENMNHCKTLQSHDDNSLLHAKSVAFPNVSARPLSMSSALSEREDLQGSRLEFEGKARLLRRAWPLLSAAWNLEAWQCGFWPGMVRFCVQCPI